MVLIEYNYKNYEGHVKTHKCNREYLISVSIEYFEDLIMESYCYLRLKYLEDNNDIFINNSTARKKLLEEELELIDLILERGVHVK